ncbi:MAG: ROK family protein [Chitinophagaceae bacterium]
MSQQHLAGIEIGGTKLQILTTDNQFSVTGSLCIKVNKETGAKGIQEEIETGLTRLMGKQKLHAIGVGFGGPVNHKTGEITVSHQIAGWESFDLKLWLQQLTGAAVFIDNDANVAALGEAVHGAGVSYETVFYITIGSGIGGGLVKNKLIYHGALPGEAEIGHLRLNKEGETLESQCSGWAVDKRIREAIKNHPDGTLAKLAGETSGAEAKFLKQAVRESDDTAVKILEETADNVAFGLSHVVHLIHPDIIIIGGGLSLLGEDLLVPVALALPKYILKSFLPGPVIKIASLGAKVVPVGALELAKNSLLMHDLQQK